MQLESKHPKQSLASSRRQSLTKKGWTEVTTKKAGDQVEVWGTPPPAAGTKGEVPALPASPEGHKDDGAVKGATAAAPPPPAPQASGTGPKRRSQPVPKGPKKSRKGIKLVNPGPRSRPKGRTSGVGVEGTWVKLFEANEELAEGKKLSDSQITARMKAEFPGRDSLVFNAVANVRAKYNRGGLTKGTKPKKQSQCYGA